MQPFISRWSLREQLRTGNHLIFDVFFVTVSDNAKNHWKMALFPSKDSTTCNLHCRFASLLQNEFKSSKKAMLQGLPPMYRNQHVFQQISLNFRLFLRVVFTPSVRTTDKFAKLTFTHPATNLISAADPGIFQKRVCKCNWGKSERPAAKEWLNNMWIVLNLAWISQRIWCTITKD